MSVFGYSWIAIFSILEWMLNKTFCQQLLSSCIKINCQWKMPGLRLRTAKRLKPKSKILLSTGQHKPSPQLRLESIARHCWPIIHNGAICNHTSGFLQKYMMDLTQYQTNVGTLLTKGNTLLQAGDLTSQQEQEVKGQVDLLNQEWEDLRVGAMERQTRWAALIRFSHWIVSRCAQTVKLGGVHWLHSILSLRTQTTNWFTA